MHVLDLAPNCSLPVRGGGERRAWSLYEGLLGSGLTGKFIGRTMVIRDLRSSPTRLEVSVWRRRKVMASFFSLLTGVDYWQFRILTPAVRDAVARCAGDEFNAVLLNFLFSVPLLGSLGGRRTRLVVDTHNYDPEVFAGFAEAARDPLTVLLCRRAIANSRRTLAALPTGSTLVHVSESDALAYRRDRPDLTHVVVENGCHLKPRAHGPDYAAGEKKRLLFVGSLSAQMNQDALRYLVQRFWPLLRSTADLTVVGSNPSPAVIRLCMEHGWRLRANVTDEELDQEYADAHYAIAPFAYGAGSKLKLMEACAHGVPVLTTPAGATGITRPPPCVHVSDEPEVWRQILRRRQAPAEDELTDTLKFAEEVSWPRLGARLAQIIAESPLIDLPDQMPRTKRRPEWFRRKAGG